MVVERITDVSHPMYDEALKLYQISFPDHERREKRSQDEIIRDEEYHFCLLYDEDAFVGLILYWEQEQFIYIEHFCILPEKRNQHYGQKALALLAGQGKTLILEIDPPIDDISKRRKGFYERCGFAKNTFPHVHPPYHQENAGHRLVLMTYPQPVSEAVFGVFSDYLKNRVMKDAFHAGALKRYISAHDRKFYTHMLEIILAIGGNNLRYQWLITDITAYPQDNGKYDQLIDQHDYLILSTSELLKMLSDCDFQWIWAVFSAIPENVDNETILQYDLPYAEGNENLHRDNAPVIQHPLADIEIVAEDSSWVSIVAKDAQIATKFKRLFPKATSNFTNAGKQLLPAWNRWRNFNGISRD